MLEMQFAIQSLGSSVRDFPLQEGFSAFAFYHNIQWHNFQSRHRLEDDSDGKYVSGKCEMFSKKKNVILWRFCLWLEVIWYVIPQRSVQEDPDWGCRNGNGASTLQGLICIPLHHWPTKYPFLENQVIKTE